MKRILSVALLILSLSVSAQDIRPIIDALMNHLDEKRPQGNILFTDQDSLPVKRVKAYLNSLKRQEEIENSFTGEFKFGIDISDSKNKELVNVMVGAELNKGNYPGEINFNSLINVQLKDGQFIENLSVLSMSYDHHFNRQLDFEGYAFIKRSSNDFLNIEQRYEVGIGAVWNVVLSGKSLKGKNIKRRLTPKGYEDYSKLTAFEVKDVDQGEKTLIQLCDEKLCQDAAISKKDRKKFNESRDRILKAIQKRESRVRLSFLAGLNYEVEATKDSLKVYYQDSIRRNSFAPKNLVRLVVAPNLELQINELTMSSRCYIKLGISKDDLNDQIEQINNETISVSKDLQTDFRIEWITSVTLKVSKKIKLTGSLNYEFINAPKRRFFDLNENNGLTEPNYMLFSAANRYTNFKIGMSYKL